MARNPSRTPPSPKPTAPEPGWAFRARFRRNAFGWRSAPAVTRIREAVAEIREAARSDPRCGAEAEGLIAAVAAAAGPGAAFLRASLGLPAPGASSQPSDAARGRS